MISYKNKNIITLHLLLHLKLRKLKAALVLLKQVQIKNILSVYQRKMNKCVYIILIYKILVAIVFKKSFSKK